jgi:virginiamycin B lyase
MTLAGSAVALSARAAGAAPVGSVKLFVDSGMSVDRVTPGPDGNLWFTNFGDNAVGRITPNGEIKAFTDSRLVGPVSIVAGADGAMWFATFDDKIGRVTTTGVFTNFYSDSKKINDPNHLVLGHDNAVWFANHGTGVGRVTTTGVISFFATTSGTTFYSADDMTVGSDGALWFADFFHDAIGRVTTSGAFTVFKNANTQNVTHITAGPDGALWFTASSSIGRITTAGVVTKYALPAPYVALDITAGSDGALWYTNYNASTQKTSAGRMTTAGVVTNRYDNPLSNMLLWDVVSGPDGALWFGVNSGVNGRDGIARVTTSGTFTNFPIHAPLRSALGSDGAVWFTTNSDTIGRIAPDGSIRYFHDPAMSQTYGITAGPDGALWFADYGNNKIGRITTNGVVTEFSDPAISNPLFITAGPDGAVWWAGSFQIGRMTTDGHVTMTKQDLGAPRGITAGPDGAIWVTHFGTHQIGRITTGGTMSTFSDATITAGMSIVEGSDGALWFANGKSIGRITTGGTVSSFTSDDVNPVDALAPAPDGSLWFVQERGFNNKTIGHILMDGTITTYSATVPGFPGASPQILTFFGITAGSDGNMWASGGYGLARITLTATVDDVTGPSVTLSTPAASVSLSSPVELTWSGSDASGIDSFAVRRQSAPWNGPFGAWSTWLAHTTGTSANASVSYGTTNCYEARAMDTLGNWSGWTSPRCTVMPLRSDQLTRSAGWTKSVSSKAFAGFSYVTKTHNAKMTRTGVVGKHLSIVVTKCSTCGTVSVKWNGKVVANVNLGRAGATSYRQVVSVAKFTSVQTGTLTIIATSPNGKPVPVEGLAINRT